LKDLSVTVSADIRQLCVEIY